MRTTTVGLHTKVLGISYVSSPRSQCGSEVKSNFELALHITHKYNTWTNNVTTINSLMPNSGTCVYVECMLYNKKYRGSACI